MKHILLFASAAALGFTGPALAKPGHGNGHAYAYGVGNGHGFGDADEVGEDGAGRQAFGYGVGGCPPGLAKKTPACIPPGLARQQQQQQQQQQQVLAQRALGYGVPYGAYANPYGAYGSPYGGYGAYGVPQIPYGAYAPYGYAAPYGYPYQVDPKTVLLQQVLGGLVR